MLQGATHLTRSDLGSFLPGLDTGVEDDGSSGIKSSSGILFAGLDRCLTTTLSSVVQVDQDFSKYMIQAPGTTRLKQVDPIIAMAHF